MFSTARLDLLPCTHGTLNAMGTSLRSLLAFSLHACSLWGSSVASCFDGRQRRRDDYDKRADLPRFAACEGRCSACSLEHSTYFCHLCVFLVPASSRNVELGSWKCGGVYVPAARAHRQSRQYRWCSGRWFNLLRQTLTSDCLPLVTKESLNSVSSCYFCFLDTIVSWIKI